MDIQDQTRIITVQVEIPTSMNGEEARHLAHEAFVMQLYAQGQITSGRAARMLGITRWEFLDSTGTYHVSIFGEDLDVKQEMDNALKIQGLCKVADSVMLPGG